MRPEGVVFRYGKHEDDRQHPERSGERFDHLEGHRRAPGFETDNLPTVNSKPVGKVFLAPPVLAAKLPELVRNGATVVCASSFAKSSHGAYSDRTVPIGQP